MDDEIVAVVEASPVRRWMGIAMLVGLGVVTIFVAAWFIAEAYVCARELWLDSEHGALESIRKDTLVLECSTPAEWASRVTYLPLR